MVPEAVDREHGSGRARNRRLLFSPHRGKPARARGPRGGHFGREAWDLKPVFTLSPFPIESGLKVVMKREVSVGN